MGKPVVHLLALEDCGWLWTRNDGEHFAASSWLNLQMVENDLEHVPLRRQRLMDCLCLNAMTTVALLTSLGLS